MRLKFVLVLSYKYLLMIDLKLNGSVQRTRARELIMKDHCVGLVHDTKTERMQAHAIVGFFVVRRFKGFVESLQSFPDRPGREQKRPGTVVDIATEHIRRSHWIVAAAVPVTGSILPDNAAGFLQQSVEQHDFPTHCADIGTAGQRAKSGRDASRQKLRVAVEQKQKIPAAFSSRLIHG